MVCSEKNATTKLRKTNHEKLTFARQTDVLSTIFITNHTYIHKRSNTTVILD